VVLSPPGNVGRLLGVSSIGLVICAAVSLVARNTWHQTTFIGGPSCILAFFSLFIYNAPAKGLQPGIGALRARRHPSYPALHR
jgi:hypothetical protein